MALKVCPDCGGDVSSTAPTCPACGRKMETLENRVQSYTALFCVALALAAVLYGCMKPGDSEGPSTSEPRTRTLTAAEFGNAWPLTVSEGKVGCVAPGAVVFIVGDRTYSVNGTADGMAATRGWYDIGPIWRDNEEQIALMREAGIADPTAKVDLGPVIDAGLALC